MSGDDKSASTAGEDVAADGARGCQACGTTGSTAFDEALRSPRGEVIGRVSGPRACVCVRDLPAVDGPVSWWESETIFEQGVLVPIGAEHVQVEVQCEVPRRRDGRRLHRTAENRYYPTLVRVGGMTMHGDTARELGEALIAAGDACDAADELPATGGQQAGMSEQDGPVSNEDPRR